MALMSMRMKLTIPASVSAMNSTIGGSGLRIAQAEMLRMTVYSTQIRRLNAT